MEGEGEVLGVLFVEEGVVLAHGVEEGLFVADHPAEFDVVGDSGDA